MLTGGAKSEAAQLGPLARKIARRQRSRAVVDEGRKRDGQKPSRSKLIAKHVIHAIHCLLSLANDHERDADANQQNAEPALRRHAFAQEKLPPQRPTA